MATRSEGTHITRGPVRTPGQGIYEESSTKLHRLGDRLEVGDRTFRYAHASEALTAGKLCTIAMDTDAEDTVTVAHPAGTTEVTVTAASTITKNQYEDGYLVVDEGTDAGSTYHIKENDAITSSSTGTVTLYDGLVSDWSTSDTDIMLYTNPYSVVQVSNTDQKEKAAGVPLVDVTSDYYFWLQTRGPAGVLQDEAFGNATGERVAAIGSGTAGAVEAADATAEAIVGEVLLDGADTEADKYYLINLQCE